MCGNIKNNDLFVADYGCQAITDNFLNNLEEVINRLVAVSAISFEYLSARG